MSRPQRRVVRNPSWNPETWDPEDDRTAPFFYDPPLPRVPPRAREPAAKPLAFANPNSYGYGGGTTPWPFDMHRARDDGRYRAGIHNAINANPRWVSSNWQHVARQALLFVESLEDDEEFVQNGYYTEFLADQYNLPPYKE